MSGKAKGVSAHLVKYEPEMALHNLFHHRGMLSAVQGVCWLALAGLQLAAEKKKAGHGKWEAWVEANCDYDIRTAQKYMGLGEGVKGRALKNESQFVFALLEKAPGDLTPADREKLIAAVQKMTDGETITGLYESFGILKLKAGAGLRGKKRKHTAAGADVNDPAEVASDLWKPILDFLENDGLETRSWKDLPQAELTRLKEAVTDLGRLLKTSHDGHKGARRK